MRRVVLEGRGRRRVFRVPAVGDWGAVAEHVMGRLRPGDVLAISGPLGAGKTTFVQSLASAFGIRRIPQSPTFALLRTYPVPGRGPIRRLIHVDAYRIENERDLLPLDLDEELADGGSVLVLEWPERVPGWLRRKTPVRLDISI